MAINLGLIGLGTVGTGVVKLLRKNKTTIEKRVGTAVHLRKVCDLNIQRAREVKINSNLFTRNADALLTDPEIDIIVELIGGINPAREIVRQAIKHHKQVVTANKALLANHWGDILSLANRHKVLVYFEASVAAGIPIIQALNEGLAANRIDSILGIFNGTTNYILSRMTAGVDFKTALKEARTSGFAEINPSVDIKGFDTRDKLSILSSIASGGWTKPQDIYVEGIENIDSRDLKYGQEEFGYRLKLLGIAKRHPDGKYEFRVHPTFIPQNHLLSSVENEFNAIYIEGDAVGSVMFYGKGAGQLPAASAVVSDIIYLARHVHNHTAGKTPYVYYDRHKQLNICKMSAVETKYYIRFTTVDRPGVLARISGILGKNNVSIASCFQKERQLAKMVPILMITHRAKEGDIRKALSQIDRLPIVKARSVLIRIEE